MAYDYTNIYNTAVTLITKFGAEFTYKQLDTSYTKSYSTEISGNIWTSGTTVLTEAPYTTNTADGVVVGFTQEDRDSTAIKQGDKRLLAVSMETPKTGDVYTIGTTDYSYVDHETIQPSSDFSPLLYRIQVRV